MPLEIAIEPRLEPGMIKEPNVQVQALLEMLEGCGSLMHIGPDGDSGYGGVLCGSYVKRVLKGLPKLGLKTQQAVKSSTMVFPRDTASYRVLSLMQAFGSGSMAIRNVAAIKGSMAMNLQRVGYQEKRLPKELKDRIYRELSLTVPESSGRLSNRFRTEMTRTDIAALDITLAALGCDALLGVCLA